MAKCDPLKNFLSDVSTGSITFSFRQIEIILGGDLPNSARTYPEWWANEEGDSTSHVQCKAWRSSGFRANVSMKEEMVKFTRS